MREYREWSIEEAKDWLEPKIKEKEEIVKKSKKKLGKEYLIGVVILILLFFGICITDNYWWRGVLEQFSYWLIFFTLCEFLYRKLKAAVKSEEFVDAAKYYIQECEEKGVVEDSMMNHLTDLNNEINKIKYRIGERAFWWTVVALILRAIALWK